MIMKDKFNGWLLLGDAAVLTAFVLAGLRTHEVTQPLIRFVVNAGPILLMWLVVGLSLRVFSLPQPITLRVAWARTLNTWLIAAPLALVVRALMLKAATIVVIFLLVTLGLGGGVMLLWRALFVWAARRGYNPAPKDQPA